VCKQATTTAICNLRLGLEYNHQESVNFGEVVEALHVLERNKAFINKKENFAMLSHYRVGAVGAAAYIGSGPKNQLRVILTKHGLLSDAGGISLEGDVGEYVKLYHLARAEFIPLVAAYNANKVEGPVQNYGDAAAIAAANWVKREQVDRIRMLRPLIAVLGGILNHM
jgi:hypothetical protein